jgi:GH18 family chitinase
LPWWSSSDHSTNYFTSGAFDAQVGMLDEVVYFGEFEFDSIGRIYYDTTRIATDSDWYITQMQNTVNRIFSVNPTPRLTFSIGGAGHSDSFATVAANATYRANAAAEIRLIIDRFGFNGADLDWEGATIPWNDATVATNYGLLAEEINGVLTAGERLTVAIQYNRYLAANAVEPHVDLIRVMTYDAPEKDTEFGGPGNHTSVVGTTDMIDDMISNGVADVKLGVGSGWYGRSLSNPWGVVPENYSALDQAYFDANGKWLPNDLTEWGDWGFDSVDSIWAKIALAEDRRLQEIFSWEMSKDSYSASHWLPLTMALTQTPEPASLACLVIGCVWLMGRRCRRRSDSTQD